MDSSKGDFVPHVWIDLAQGVANLSNVRVSIAIAGLHGELQVGGTSGSILRPLRFLERNRAVLHALQVPNPALSLSAEVLQLATVRRGDNEVIVLETLALIMAGARLQSRTVSYVEAAVAVGRAGGWNLSQIESAEAQFIDHLADELIGDVDEQTMAQHQSEWTALVFNPSPEEELERLCRFLAEGLLRRARPTMIQLTTRLRGEQGISSTSIDREIRSQEPMKHPGSLQYDSVSASRLASTPAPSPSTGWPDQQRPSVQRALMEMKETVKGQTLAGQESVKASTSIASGSSYESNAVAPISFENDAQAAGSVQSLPLHASLQTGISPIRDRERFPEYYRTASHLNAFDAGGVPGRLSIAEIYDLSNLGEVADALAASLQDEADLRGIDI